MSFITVGSNPGRNLLDQLLNQFLDLGRVWFVIPLYPPRSPDCTTIDVCVILYRDPESQTVTHSVTGRRFPTRRQ